MKKSNLNVVDGILLELLGDYHRHLCASCDCSKTGCANCRFTGYDQTPCKICDKDGIAFKNRKDTINKLEKLIKKERKESFYLACKLFNINADISKAVYKASLKVNLLRRKSNGM